jgi:hypothetical protein
MSQTLAHPADAEVLERFRLAGIVLPAERQENAISTGRNYLGLLHWLRSPRSAAVEPANTFSLVAKEL